jgi:preprotein translocase subunit SecG
VHEPGERAKRATLPGGRKDAVMASEFLLWAVPAWLPGLMNVVLLLSGIFLIGLVLIQRGKGGGLAGAFGGAGGSSAFGSRAGDTFTKVTIYVAAVWILLIMFLIKMTQPTDPLPNQSTIERPE